MAGAVLYELLLLYTFQPSLDNPRGALVEGEKSELLISGPSSRYGVLCRGRGRKRPSIFLRS